MKRFSMYFVSLLIHFGQWLPDKTYLKLMYRFMMGRSLDLKHPKRFSEKLQWIKLYDRKPEYTTMVDKITAKSYVASIIGDKYIIPTLGTWYHFDEIDFDTLPNKFVLKTNHGGGGIGVVICKDKANFDKGRAKKLLEQSLKKSTYLYYREWPYKNVKPMILAEQLLEDKDENGRELNLQNDDGISDYKFYCFDGIPKVIMIASNRFTTHNFNYFDMDFKPLPITSVEGKPIDNSLIRKPSSFEEMKTIAKALSRGLSHVRVDLYEVSGKPYFGELTIFDSSGYDNLNSDTVDLLWGSWMTLPSKNRL